MPVVKVTTKNPDFEAIQFTGNDKECLEFCSWAIDPEDTRPTLMIMTPYGNGYMCEVGDWIVKATERDFTVFTNEEFHEVFEVVE